MTASSAWQIIERLETRIEDQKVRLDVQAQQIKKQDMDIERLGQRLKDAEKEARIARLQLKESQRKGDKFKRQSDEERTLRVQSIQALKKQIEKLRVHMWQACWRNELDDVDDPPVCMFSPAWQEPDPL